MTKQGFGEDKLQKCIHAPAKWRDSILVKYEYKNKTEKKALLKEMEERRKQLPPATELVPMVYRVNRKYIERLALELDSSKKFREGLGPKPKYTSCPEGDSVFTIMIGQKKKQLVYTNYTRELLVSSNESQIKDDYLSLHFYYSHPDFLCTISMLGSSVIFTLSEFSSKLYKNNTVKNNPDLIYFLNIPPFTY